MSEPESMLDALAALADPTRWQVLSLLAQQGSASATSVAAALPVSRPAVVKHIGVLERAGLVEGRRAGREMCWAVRPERLDAVARWMAGVAFEWDVRLAGLRRLAEAG